MAAESELRIVIRARDEARGVLASVEREARGLGGTLADVGKIASGFLAANVIMGGARALTDQIGSIITSANEAIKAEAQLDAVLKSTGGVAGVTREQALALASSFQSMTTFSDEAVLGAENLLLTFTGIGKDVFPTALSAVLDMSTALGQDLQSSALQLGKALQDPVRGITALRRVGVNFSEDQQRVIASLVETGRVADAQRLILEELAREFGGSAQAQAQTFAGRMAQLRNRIDDLKESIGRALIPVLSAVAGALAGQVLPAVERLTARLVGVLGPAVQGVAAAFGVLVTGDFRGGIFGLSEDHPFVLFLLRAHRLLQDVGNALRDAFRPGGPVVQALRELQEPARELLVALAQLGGAIVTWAQALVPAVRDVATWLRESGIAAAALDGLRTLLEAAALGAEALAQGLAVVGRFLQEHRPAAIALAVALGVVLAVLLPMPAAIAAVVLAVGLLRRHWDDLRARAVAIWSGIRQAVDEHLGGVVDIVRTAIGIIENLVTTGFKLVRDIVVFVLAVIRGDWEGAWRALRQLGSDVLEGIVNDLRLRLRLAAEVLDLAGQVMLFLWGAAWARIRDAVLATLGALAEDVRALGGRIGAALDEVGRVGLFIVAGVWAAIRDNVRGTLAGMASDALEMGRRVVEGLWDGIQSLRGWLLDRVRDFVRGIVDAMKRAFGPFWPFSPSEAGLAIARGLVEGLEAGLRREREHLRQVVSGEARRMQVMLAVPQGVRTPLPAAAPVVQVRVPPQQSGPRAVYVDRIEVRADLNELLQALGVV